MFIQNKFSGLRTFWLKSFFIYTYTKEFNVI